MILYYRWIKLGYSKWKEGKNFSYFLYRLWLWFGVKTRVVVTPPSPAAMINTADTKRNSLVSFPVTLINPTINPNTTSKELNHGVAEPRLTNPRTIATITPTIKE